jgi:hypothetical protein
MTVSPTYVDYTGNGVSTDFVFPFPYMSASHVKVAVGGTETTAFTLQSTSTVRFNSAPSAGALIHIFRETPSTPIVTWEDGALILGRDLNSSTLQSLYLAQEAANNAWDAQRGNVGPVDGGNAASSYTTFYPAGWKGDKGDKGDTGATGAKGDTGATGAAGANGTSVSAPTIHVYSSVGTVTYTKPAGCRKIRYRVQGGGGAGGGAATGAYWGVGGGGGAGGNTEGWLDVSAISTISVTVGVGGAGVSGAAGNAGSTSSLGAYASADGGAGGGALAVAGTGWVDGGAGGTATGGSINLTGERGSRGRIIYANTALAFGGDGGSSPFGGRGAGTDSYNNIAGTAGMDATGPGSGGGGAATGTTNVAGGAGATGRVIIEEFY